MDELTDMGNLYFYVCLLFLISHFIYTSKMLYQFFIFLVFACAAAQKKKELAEQLKDASKNFEVGF